MMTREQLEKLLRLNGLEKTAKDEEIKSVLLSARYKEDEIDAAIMVLRENKHSHKTKVDGLHKVFRSDGSLSSAEISSLLGIDVDLEHRVEAGARARQFSMMSQTLLFLLSILIGLIAVLLYMYTSEIGIFHPTSAIAAPRLK